MIELLVSQGVDINHKSVLNRTGLSKACYLGRVDIVKYLLNLSDIKIDSPDNKGRTPLHNASWGV